MLGLYFMTRSRVNAKGEGMIFANVKEVHRAYDSRAVDLQACVKVRLTDWVMGDDGEFAERTQIWIPRSGGRCSLKFYPWASPST